MIKEELKTKDYLVENRSKINVDSIFGLLLTLISIVFIFYIVPKFIEEPISNNNPLMSPRFIPLITGWGILVLSIFLTIQGALNPKIKNIQKKFDTPMIRWVPMLASFVIYMFLFEYLGAVISAFLASSLLLVASKIKGISLYLLVLIFPFLMYLFFVYLLNVPLPIGDIWY